MPATPEADNQPQIVAEPEDPLDPKGFAYYSTRPLDEFYPERYTAYLTVEPALRQLKDGHGIAVQTLPWGELPPYDGQPAYVLVGPVNPAGLSAADRRHLAELAGLASVNLAPLYGFSLAGANGAYRQAGRIATPAVIKGLAVNIIGASDLKGADYAIAASSPADIIENLLDQTMGPASADEENMVAQAELAETDSKLSIAA